jgi:hypothetical protein
MISDYRRGIAMRHEPVTLNEPVENHYAIKRHALLRRKALDVKECRVMAHTVPN